MISNNNNITLTLLESLRTLKINPILMICSTSEVYGLVKKNEIADENHKLNPLSNYAKQKVKIENYLISLKDRVNFSATILRFATAFGLSPRMRFDLTINHFTKAILEKKLLNIYDANTWRPYCHVYDFARLIEKILLTDKEKIYFQIFNAGDNKNNFTKKSIIEAVVKIIPGKNFVFEKNDTDKRDYKVNFNKVKKILNFETKYTIHYGIREISEMMKSGFFDAPEIDINKLGNFRISL